MFDWVLNTRMRLLMSLMKTLVTNTEYIQINIRETRKMSVDTIFIAFTGVGTNIWLWGH